MLELLFAVVINVVQVGQVLTFALTKSVRITLLTCKVAHTVSGLNEPSGVPA